MHIDITINLDISYEIRFGLIILLVSCMNFATVVIYHINRY
jgi:hypothetical protein